jgi:hypothetical protein
MEGAGLTITGLIATVLSLIFAFAVHATNRKRQRDRQALQAAIKERDEAYASPYDGTGDAESVQGLAPEPPPNRTQITPAPERPPAAPQYSPAQPASAPARPAPRAVPVSSGPPVFKQYVTRPGVKTPTPVTVQAPTDQDFVWE